MHRQLSRGASLAFVCFFMLLSGLASPIASAQALTASLTTDRGCGASAVYNLGERNTFLFRVSQAAQVTLRLQRPDGSVSILLANQPLQGGITYALQGIIGNPTGQRTLTLDAVAGAQTAHATCSYTAQSASSNLTATLQTNKGCGANALFNLGEASTFRFSVSQTALVTLRLLRPDGTISTLLANQPVPGGVTRTINGVVGSPTGTRRLLLDAVAGSQTAHVECDYTAQGTTAPLTVSLTTNHGCGAGALFNLGEASTFTYSASKNAVVTLQLIRPDGSTSTLVANRPVQAGVISAIQGVVGSPIGQRRLILTAVAGSETAQMECDYTAQSTGGGPVTLSLSIDRGCGASYRVGQLITVTYSASANTTLTLADQQAGGSVSTIFANRPVLAGQTYSLTGVIGSQLGGRTLVLTASSGQSANPATCQFTVTP